MISNFKLKISNSIIALVFFACFLNSHIAYAQSTERLWLSVNSSRLAPASEVLVEVLFDSTNPVNAFELELSYPNLLLKPVSFSDGSSVVDLWKTRQWENNDGVIKLSGGMLKPFWGNNGKIAEFKFDALQEGVAEISFKNFSVYYADGAGTLAQVRAESAQIIIDKNASLISAEELVDNSSPLFGFLETAKDPKGKNYLAVFDVKDMGSGIESVRIRQMKWFLFDDWRVAYSPVEIFKGTWCYQILAIDNNGNHSVKTLFILKEVVNKFFGVILFLLAISIFYYIINLYYKKLKKNKFYQ